MEENENKKQGKFGKGFVAGVFTTLIILLLIFGLGTAMIAFSGMSLMDDKEKAEEEKTDVSDINFEEIEPKLSYIEDLVNEYFLFDEDVDQQELEDMIYRGYLAGLDDPYTVYYNPEEYKEMNEEIEGEYCGIGVMVSQDMRTKIITVLQVFSDSPAAEAGMRPGDLLYKVNGEEIADEDLDLLVKKKIRGEEGTTVDIEVYRESIDDYVDMTIERRMVQNETVLYDMLEGHIGYISVSSFDVVTEDQFIKAVDILESKNMKGLIIDLRNNGGGMLQAAESMIDYILPKDKLIVSFKSKTQPDEEIYTKDDHEVTVPVVLLVNEGSASASEVMTGALKDNDAAVVVGEKTFGKGIAQGFFDLADGSAVKMTTAYYYVPSGECIHEIGIEPDVKVDLPKELKYEITIPKEEDTQLQAAIEVLKNGTEAAKEKYEVTDEEADDAA